MLEVLEHFLAASLLLSLSNDPSRVLPTFFAGRLGDFCTFMSDSVRYESWSSLRGVCRGRRRFRRLDPEQ